MLWRIATSFAQWISRAARRGVPVAIVGLACATSAWADPPAGTDPSVNGGAPVAAPTTANAIATLPPVSAGPTQMVAYNQPQADARPVGYLSPEFEARLDELQQTVARQQSQIQAQQAQVQALQQQVQPGSGKISNVSQNIPGATNDLYPGGAAPAFGGGGGGGAGFVPGADTAPPIDDIYPGSAAPLPGVLRSTAPYVIGSDRGLIGAWTNNGPVFATRNGDFTFHPRFVSQLDVIAVHSPPAGVTIPGGNSAGSQDSVDFRRLRLGCDGTMWETIDYVFEADFAFALTNTEPTSSTLQQTGLRSTGTLNGGQQGGNAITLFQPTTVFLTYKEMPLLGNIRVGNQQDWISLEHIESARFQDFMERSPLMDAFYGPNNNGYTPGISTYRTYLDNNLAFQAGVYKANYYDSGFPYDIGNNNYSYGGRIHCTPYYDEPTNGRYLLHVGVGGQYRTFNTNLSANQNGDNVRVRARGDLRNVASTLDPNFADTGNFYATGQSVIDPEFAFQWGSLLIQGEYTYSTFTNAATNQPGTAGAVSTPLGGVAFRGGYVEALYFLTGENRVYQRESGVFARTIPLRNAFLTRGAGIGWGAWQIGGRFDWLDLNSGAIQGGQLTDYTFGLNWFLNPNARFQFNYVLAHVNSGGAGPLASAVSGALEGSRVSGIGNVSLAGCRMDFNF